MVFYSSNDAHDFPQFQQDVSNERCKRRSSLRRSGSKSKSTIRRASIQKLKLVGVTVDSKSQKHCPQCPYPNRDDLTGWRWLRAEMHFVLDHPNHSSLAWFISLFIMLAICVSTVTFVIETDPNLKDWPGWVVFEVIIVTLFSLEYVLRLLVCRDKMAFLTKLYNVVDLAAILPFFLEMAITDSSDGDFLRVLRVVRLARVLRLFKRPAFVIFHQILKETLARSSDAFGLLASCLFLVLIVFATLMFYAEKGTLEKSTGQYLRSDGKVSPFVSILASFYWATTTVTTIGYGDLVPVEPFGRAIASLAMIISVLVIALPVIVVGSNFEHVYRQYRPLLRRSKSSEKRVSSVASKAKGFFAKCCSKPIPPSIDLTGAESSNPPSDTDVYDDDLESDRFDDIVAATSSSRKQPNKSSNAGNSAGEASPAAIAIDVMASANPKQPSESSSDNPAQTSSVEAGQITHRRRSSTESDVLDKSSADPVSPRGSSSRRPFLRSSSQRSLGGGKKISKTKSLGSKSNPFPCITQLLVRKHSSKNLEKFVDTAEIVDGSLQPTPGSKTLTPDVIELESPGLAGLSQSSRPSSDSTLGGNGAKVSLGLLEIRHKLFMLEHLMAADEWIGQDKDDAMLWECARMLDEYYELSDDPPVCML